MFGSYRLARRFALFSLILGSGLAQADTLGAGGQRVGLTIVDFVYVDTSGEPVDQIAAHQMRLHAFMDALRQDFAGNDRFQLVGISCEPTSCKSEGAPSADLMRAATKAGAKILVIGGFHKVSTLVQWAKVQAIDLDTNQCVFDRLFTFRGDSDEAWRRAEGFVSQDIRAALSTQASLK